MGNYVYNSNGLACGPIEDAEVIVIPDEVPESNVEDAVLAVNETGDDDTLDVLSEQRISVVRLLNIAYLAKATLVSGLGVEEINRLARELEDAGLAEADSLTLVYHWDL